ncbi:MAG: N-acetylmuramoyl-L-alanine amidase [Bacteroidetes bacterium]|nr:N-acetylmuramoyl-L-alanine amidase [Bacteroidota bacterium]
MISLIFLCTTVVQGQGRSEVKIISKPISYDKERINLSLEYLRERHGLIQESPTISPKIIVLHYTAGGTLTSNFNYFNPARIENSRELNKNQSHLNVSAHYLIDRGGEIYQLMEDTQFARHTIGLNYCAIGIENVGSKSQPLTEAQVISNAKLIRHLKKKYPIEFLIGHHEYWKFRGSNWWKESNSSYFTGKEDPGSEFMQKVRDKIKDLKLKSEP